jgi:hypothetical protein
MKTAAIVGCAWLMASVGCVGGDELEEVGEVEQAIDEAPAPDANSRVTFGRDGKERTHGVRIHDKPHQSPEVVFTVRLKDLTSSEELRLRGEVTLSRCNKKDIAGQSGDAKTTPCNSSQMKKHPYGYNPRFAAAFVLADSPKDGKGKPLSKWVDTVCTEGEHHCALILPEAVADKLPNAAMKYVNLVVSADHNGARSWDVMEVEHRHGSLSVTRVAPGAQKVASGKTQQIETKGSMTIDRPHEDGDPTQVKQLIYQLKLTGLQSGDVVDADARMRALLGGGLGNCDPLITGELILTDDPKARDKKKPHDEVLTAKNGANCTDHGNGGCKYGKSGAVRLGKGTPSTMYLSYVAVALRSCIAANGSDKWRLHPNGGFLSVGVRR